MALIQWGPVRGLSDVDGDLVQNYVCNIKYDTVGGCVCARIDRHKLPTSCSLISLKIEFITRAPVFLPLCIVVIYNVVI